MFGTVCLAIMDAGGTRLRRYSILRILIGLHGFILPYTAAHRFAIVIMVLNDIFMWVDVHVRCVHNVIFQNGGGEYLFL